MMEVEEVKAYYEKRTSYHEGYFKNKNSRTVVLLKMIDNIYNEFEFKSALDIGCGVGITSEHLRRCCKKVTATDLAENAIRVAKERNIYSDVNYIAGDFTKMNLNEKFDLVCLFDVLEHILPQHREAFLNNVKDHCNNIIAVSIPNPNNTKKLKATNPKILQIVDEEITEDYFKDFTIINKSGNSIYLYYLLKII